MVENPMTLLKESLLDDEYTSFLDDMTKETPKQQARFKKLQEQFLMAREEYKNAEDQYFRSQKPFAAKWIKMSTPKGYRASRRPDQMRIMLTWIFIVIGILFVPMLLFKFTHE